MATLFQDPQHRERLVALGRERAAKFSWDKAAASTSVILRKAAGLTADGPDEYRA